MVMKTVLAFIVISRRRDDYYLWTSIARLASFPYSQVSTGGTPNPCDQANSRDQLEWGNSETGYEKLSSNVILLKIYCFKDIYGSGKSIEQV